MATYHLRVLCATALFFAVTLLLVSCGGAKDYQRFAPQVIDEAGIFDSATTQQIQEFQFPEDIPVLVRTVHEISPSEIGFYASENMKTEDYWESVRPKGWWRRAFKRDKSRSTGIYVLVSEEPGLVQIRFGERIRIEAFRQGLVVGLKYLEIQNDWASTDPNGSIIKTMDKLSIEVEDMMDTPFYFNWFRNAIAFTFAEFSDFIAPSDGIYTNWVFKPYLKIWADLPIPLSPWVFVLLNVGAFFLVRAIINQIILRPIKSWRPGLFKFLRVIFEYVVLLYFALPFLASVFLLANGRMEDQLALVYFQFPFSEKFTIGYKHFIRPSGLLWAIVVSIINCVKLNMTDPAGINQPGQYAQSGGINYGSSYPIISSGDSGFYYPNPWWIVIFSFLPLAVTWVMMLKEVFEIITGLRDAVDSESD